MYRGGERKKGMFTSGSKKKGKIVPKPARAMRRYFFRTKGC
jgi:hypothetical protein